MTHLPEIKMEGRSGCRLEVMKSGEHVIIKKHSSSIAYNKRLIKQAEKQQHFFQNLPAESRFSTARVIDILPSQDSLASFTMPYLFSEKYSDHLEKISFSDLKILLQDIINYLSQNIRQSKYEFVDGAIISSKVEELKTTIQRNIHMGDSRFLWEVINFLEKNVPSDPLPIGKCHGDLTFSNILFSDSKIYFLDFLDSFIESPVIDIVKLRQDTCFKWSVMLEKQMPVHKKNKIIQTFDYLDNEIAAFCSNELGMGTWYNYLQVFNLIRIFPYLDKREEMAFIEKSLRRIIKCI
ncbi:MAG TPA: phosphotransferase [Segetibacter sp.]|jgi:thiamine kinase-like enzyme